MNELIYAVKVLLVISLYGLLIYGLVAGIHMEVANWMLFQWIKRGYRKHPEKESFYRDCADSWGMSREFDRLNELKETKE